MNCLRCKAANESGARFCEDCGARLDVACPSCGQPVTLGKRFCKSCGADLTGVVAEADARFASPQSYTPKHLAEKILTSKAALEGERKLVTVLFADMKGSMELLADRDPEEARQILDPVLERMMEAVHRYEGTVNQVMGDGIMALFGAPVAHEDHAVRACYAALRMQEAIGRYGDEILRSQGVPIQIRVGLNSGEVVVRSIGSDLRMDYTAVGQTTHLAARMEQMAKPGSTLLASDTLRLAEGYVQVKPIGAVTIRGLPEPLEVYELTGAGQAHTRFQAAAIRGLTRFVGRDSQIEHLRQVLTQAAAGHGQVVSIVGEAGVGKSRLVYEFTHSHRVQDWLILEAASVSYGKATSYLPVTELLKGYFKIGHRDDHRAMRDKVLGRVLGLDRALESLVSPLLAILDLPVDDPAWQALDPPQRRQRTLDALKQVLLRESRMQPLLVLFEDLHWIDGETQAFLDSLVESLGSARLLLLVNYRPEYEHRWGSKTFYSQLRLDSLPVESAAELLQALLGADPGLASLKQMLVKRGNPFFLEETIRALVETKALVGERGAYRLARRVETLQVPETVQAILAARIDRLPPEEKQLLLAASVVGKDVPYAILEAIAEQPVETLHGALAHLQEAEFLYETQAFPDLEYTFKHALTHEVTYGSLLQARRRALHARVVIVVERLYPDRQAEQVELLAHHAFRGEVWEKAVTFLRQAGAKAAARSALREAVACFDQALLALQHLPESRDTLGQSIDLRFDLRNALLPLGERERILDHLREAESLAGALDDQHRLGQVFAYLTHYFWQMGAPDRAIEVGQRALGIAAAHGDFPLQVTMNFHLGQVYHTLGDYRRAVQFVRGNVEALEGDLVRERFGLPGLSSVLSRGWLASTLAEVGAFSEGNVYGAEAVRIAEAVDHPFTRVVASYHVGGLYLRQGDLERAISMLERGLTLCQVAGIPYLFPRIASDLGSAYAMSGRLAEALSLLEQAVDRAISIRLVTDRALWIASLGEAYLLAGRSDEATGLAKQALALSREHKERGNEAWVLRLLAEIASRHDPPEIETARDQYHQGLVRAEELGMRPLVAHCHLGLGRLYRRMGEPEQAREHLTTAATMYREMDMHFWLEKAEAQLKGSE